MKLSILRFEASLMSFGGPKASSSYEDTRDFPPLSMMTGLLANALGYDHGEFERHQRLQKSITYAVREDVPGSLLTDFQTVDFTSDKMEADTKRDSRAWTTWSALDNRAGGSDTDRDIRRRQYLVGARYTVTLHVESMPAEEVCLALNRPERPLFIGRKACIPSARLARQVVEAESPQDALMLEETYAKDMQERPRLWHESKDGMPVTDKRDWKNQIHTGQRLITETRFDPAKVSDR